MNILLLDIMDTLVRDPFHDALPAFFGLDTASYLEQKDREAWIRFELGEIDEATFCAQMFSDRREVDVDGLRKTLSDAYELIEGIEPLLKELTEAGFEMHALSNYPVWYRLIEEKLRLSRWISWSFVSCETGFRKPDPTTYISAARVLGVPRDALIFVDDKKRNTHAAEQAGVPSVRFSGAVALRSAILG